MLAHHPPLRSLCSYPCPSDPGDLSERQIRVPVIRHYVDQHLASASSFLWLDSTRGARRAPPHGPLRYPDTNGLFVSEWAPDGSRERRRLDIAGSVGGVRVRFEDPAEAPAVVLASQRIDDNLGWRSLDPGELLHVDEKLNVTSTIVVDGPPAQPLTRADLRCARLG